MKRKLISLVLLLNVFLLTSCFGNDYLNKNVEDMNKWELNQYQKYLEKNNEYFKNALDEAIDISDGKSEEEIIEMINYLNEEVIKSNVMLTNEAKTIYNRYSIMTGSGSIIKEDEDYYYVLTNNHVIYAFGSKANYYVYDYLNNEYAASIVFSNASYDMAVLKFEKGKQKLRIVNMAKDDIAINKNVIAVGQPGGQRNAITFGEAIKYDEVECYQCHKDESNVKYDCLYYNAITTHGNSGGMLLDYDYNMVAIVTFGMNADNGNYMYGAGSPASKIREFLALYEFELGDENV